MEVTSPPIFGIILIGLLLLFICLRVPIAISLFVTSIIGLYILGDNETILHSLKTIPFSKIASWSLLPIPLFILMGHLSFAAGISNKAYDTASKWLGWLPGGLGVATMGACGLFAACSGSSVATAGTMGRVALPEMLDKGYEKKFASGAVASGALVGIMIPPSIIFVIYGIVTETSIARLLLAGILPGVLTVTLFSIYIVIRAIKDPSVAPRGKKYDWKDKFASLLNVWGIAVLAAVILGGIYSGIFTPSEAAAMGCFVAFIFALIQGKEAYPESVKAFRETVSVSSMIFLLIAGAGMLSFTITMGGVPQWFAETIVSIPVPRFFILLIIICIYFVLGMFVDTISMMLVTLPVIFPVILELGYDPIWFGVIIVKFNELGLITPPVGVNVYVIQGVSPPGITLEDVFKGTFPFLFIELISLAILIALPIISLWLPSTMKGF